MLSLESQYSLCIVLRNTAWAKVEEILIRFSEQSLNHSITSSNPNDLSTGKKQNSTLTSQPLLQHSSQNHTTDKVSSSSWLRLEDAETETKEPGPEGPCN